MTAEQVAVFREISGRTVPPTTPAREAWFIVGRRGGKTRMAATIAVYLAIFRDYSAVLAPGEVGEVLLVAANRTQARSAFRFIRGMLETALLRPYVLGEPKRERITLRNRVEISITTASVTAGRSATAVAVILDETAFFKTSENSVNRDTEVLAAVRPSLGTTGGLLVAISSPYARKGAVWSAHKDHFGRDGDPTLVLQAPTRMMFPSFDAQTVAAAYAADEVVAKTEYGAQFRGDLESYIDPLALQACVAQGRMSQPPSLHVRHYHAFCDPAGGSGKDSMTLAISHLDPRTNLVVLDQLVEQRPPFSPEETVAGFAALLKDYGIRMVTGDKFGGLWPAERFKVHGIHYVPADKSKSQIYLECLPLLTGRGCELLDIPRLTQQFTALERRTSWGGRDSVDAPGGLPEDCANSTAGALVLAASTRRRGLRPTAVTSLQKPTVEIVLEPLPTRVRHRDF